MQQEFIIEFIKYIRGKGHTWKIGIETSLNVDKYPKELISLLDFIICDIKDTNNEIYREYTGQDNYNVMVNLKRLLNVTDFSSRALDNEFSIKLRLPLIHGYNTYKDIEKSEKLLEDTYLFAKYELDKFEYRFGGRES